MEDVFFAINILLLLKVIIVLGVIALFNLIPLIIKEIPKKNKISKG